MIVTICSYIVGTLTIDIINANNHAPEFVDIDGENTVYEEGLPGSLVMVISAKDADRNLVSYEMLNQSLPGALAIDEYTGGCSFHIHNAVHEKAIPRF